MPDLGVGLVHLPGLGPLLDELETSPDVIEIEPQAWWSDTRGERGFQINAALLEQAAGNGPVLVHSVGYPIGGRSDGDHRQIAALRETLAFLKPAWWSEHASFIYAGPESDRRHLGFLMPPVQSIESVGVIADRIRRIQDLFGLPFAFETGVNYLRPTEGELPDGIFWAEIADRTECGILLDLHNIWTNAVNGREPLRDVISELPRERIWEMHMAGGQAHNGYWLDSHSGLPSAELISLAAEIVPKLPCLHAIVFEIIPDYLPASQVTAQDLSVCLSALRSIWNERGTRTSSDVVASSQARCPDQARSMECHEAALQQALCQADPGGPLSDDPGIAIYRDLIGMARRGMIVEALPLSLAYLMRSHGEHAVDRIFYQFWASTPLRPFVSEEAQSFAQFVAGRTSLPHLGEVLEFELAAHRVAITGQPASVQFSCEPEPLIRSLKAAAGPPDIKPCLTSVEITPPAAALPSRPRKLTETMRTTGGING